MTDVSPYFTKTHQRGFGTFPLFGDGLANAVAIAAEVGYRAFDTAQIYGNEADLGRALADLCLPRSELLVTTKIEHDNMPPDRFLPSLRQSLDHLRLDRVDVLLLHFPPLDGPVESALDLLVEARERGLTTHIGVSNYTPDLMRRACRALGNGTLVCNQVEFHPLLDGRPLLDAAAETGIPLVGFCTVARGAVFKHQVFAEIGAVYSKSAGQVVLRWALQKGVALTTMSTKQDNIALNFNIMDFTLSAAEMVTIDAFQVANHRIITREGGVPWAPQW